MTRLAVVINDLANSWTCHRCNYFWGCRQFRRRQKKSPINDFLKRCWWHPGWQHRMAAGCVNQSRTTGIDFSLSLFLSLPPPCRTVSPELKSYALGVLFLLLRLLGRYKSCMSFSPSLCSLMEHSVFNVQKLISAPRRAVVVVSEVWDTGAQDLSMKNFASRLLKALFLLFVLC